MNGRLNLPSETVNYVWLNITIYTHKMLYNGSQTDKHTGIDKNWIGGLTTEVPRSRHHQSRVLAHLSQSNSRTF